MWKEDGNGWNGRKSLPHRSVEVSAGFPRKMKRKKLTHGIHVDSTERWGKRSMSGVDVGHDLVDGLLEARIGAHLLLHLF